GNDVAVHPRMTTMKMMMLMMMRPIHTLPPFGTLSIAVVVDVDDDAVLVVDSVEAVVAAGVGTSALRIVSSVDGASRAGCCRRPLDCHIRCLLHLHNDLLLLHLLCLLLDLLLLLHHVYPWWQSRCVPPR